MNKILKNISGKLETVFVHISLQDQVLFARHLAIMTKAGMPLVDSLKMLQKQTGSRSMKKILDHLVADVSNGQFLASSLESFRSIFGDLFVNIIRIGEASGILSENLNYLAEELKKKQELRGKVIGAMIYPLIILLATFGISGLLTVFIFPKIMPVFQSLNIKLPWTTMLLIRTSDFLGNYWIYTVLGFFGFIIFLFLVVKIPKVKFYWHLFLLRIPVIGPLVRAVNLTNISRTLGLTLKSGLQLLKAISITADTLPNLVYKQELQIIAQELTKGEQVSRRLAIRPHLFPPMLTQMVMVGENTGNLSETFLYLADFYESSVDEFTKNLSNILEPVMMIVMGVMVGFIAISIITPIYEVTQSFRK